MSAEGDVSLRDGASPEAWLARPSVTYIHPYRAQKPEVDVPQ